MIETAAYEISACDANIVLICAKTILIDFRNSTYLSNFHGSISSHWT